MTIIYTHCGLSWLTSWLFLTYLVTISLTSEEDTVELLWTPCGEKSGDTDWKGDHTSSTVMVWKSEVRTYKLHVHDMQLQRRKKSLQKTMMAHVCFSYDIFFCFWSGTFRQYRSKIMHSTDREQSLTDPQYHNYLQFMITIDAGDWISPIFTTDLYDSLTDQAGKELGYLH